MKQLHRLPLVLTVVSAFGLFGASTSCTLNAGSSKEAAAPVWADAVRSGALLVDVRSQGEWDQGHVDGARLLPIDEIEARIGELEQWAGGDKSKPVVLYCRSGGRAGRARDILLKAGFTHVENAGGYDAVRAALASAPAR